MLLGTGRVDVNLKDRAEKMLLSYAKNMGEDMVRQMESVN